jgi:hypothetical protein
MTTAEQIRETIALYSKHGWKLRRVLLSAVTRSALSDRSSELFEDCVPKDCSFDGLWFSRRSHPGSEAWELRRLSDSPFALVEVIEDGTSEDDLENLLCETENRMAETLTRGNGRV